MTTPSAHAGVCGGDATADDGVRAFRFDMPRGFDGTFAGLLGHAAQAYKNVPAIWRANGEKTSFSQLERDAHAVAGALADAGAPQGSLVRVTIDDAALFAASFYGVALAGCTAVLCPLPAAAEPPYGLNASLVRDILAGGPFDGARLRRDGDATLDCGAASGERMACIMGSSGTLGEPKAVMLTEKGLVADALAGLAGYPYEVGTRIEHLVPFKHAFGLTCDLNAAVAAGATICVPESPAAFLARMSLFAPAALNLPPRAAEMLLTAMEKASDGAAVTGGALRKILCGGSALGVATARGLEGYGIGVHGCYGLTECSPCVSVCASGPFEVGSCGNPLACNRVRISAEAEILVEGINVMAGYYGRPELTTSVLEGGVLHTGDRGSVDERGCLHVEGRLDNVLVLGDGRLLSPEVVERELCSCPAINEALVWLDADGSLVANLYVPSASGRSEARGLVESLVLEGGRRIDRVEFCSAPLPRTLLGKVVRSR